MFTFITFDKLSVYLNETIIADKNSKYRGIKQQKTESEDDVQQDVRI